MVKRAIYVGRFSPFHKGHLAIMQKKIDQGVPLLILVRDTHYDLYPPMLRKRMIEAAMAKLKVDAKVVIIDDIESINYGRGVGYEINEIQVPKTIKRISATDLRTKIENKDNSWKTFIPLGADKVLQDYLSDHGVVVWLTGLPKSGKSSIAKGVSYELEKLGYKTERLDSSVMRKSISKDLRFSREDRDRNNERAMYVAQMLARNGTIVLCSFITPYETQRKQIRKELEKHGSYVEVFVKSTIKKCMARDKEGLYKKALNGKIKYFTGVSDPFEEPKKPELVVDTDKVTIKKAAQQLVKFLKPMI